MTTPTPADGPQGQWTVDEDGDYLSWGNGRIGITPWRRSEDFDTNACIQDEAFDALVALVNARPAPARVESRRTELRTALDALDEANTAAAKQHGAPPPWPVRPGTPGAVIDAARNLLTALDDTATRTDAVKS